ncbi:hypothetical protein D9V29_12235 [Mycetocola manganoxydans]|uniref:Lipoprotein n=1 Tax=Mycetocola manganoxydans TaxID=699879 RepID=A0A3L6ZM42_9MICO|nr:hypothetical protein [Mycetocola manganoxydans]RLP69024.1 hypothetical protein D9V29_12235 [Mycetocola manganoxydans]GHD52915.1 hypothetical protein GCM10008097_29230 [Mycetocola manganoxydans]
MNKTAHRARTFALLSTIPLALALTGCSVVDGFNPKEQSVSFDTAAEVTDRWKGDAAWLPADATAIEIRESTIDDTAVLLAASDAELDPELCAVVSRQSAPAYQVEGSPDPYKAGEVFACGTWTVMAAEDGWFGWNPNHPDEAQQSPTR